MASDGEQTPAAGRDSRATEEDDQILLQAEERRKRKQIELQKKRTAHFRRSTADKDGRKVQICRRAKTDPAPVNDLLKPYLKRSGLTAKAAEKQGKIQDLWYTVVGEEIGGKTRPAGFSRGVLTVAVESAALRQELENFYSQSLLQSLREAEPKLTIRALRFRLANKRDTST